MFCIGTYPLTTFLVSKLQSFVVNAWICFVKVMGTHALQIQSFGFVKAKFPSLTYHSLRIMDKISSFVVDNVHCPSCICTVNSTLGKNLNILASNIDISLIS